MIVLRNLIAILVTILIGMYNAVYYNIAHILYLFSKRYDCLKKIL
jgi:hypothetical protein